MMRDLNVVRCLSFGRTLILLVALPSIAAAQLVPVWEWRVTPCPALQPGETQEQRAQRCGRYEFYQPRDNIRFVSEGKWIDALIPEFPDLAELQKQVAALQQAVTTLNAQNAALEKRVATLEDKIIPLPTPAMARCIHEHLIVPLVARDRGGRTQENDFKNCMVAALQQGGEAAVSLSRAHHKSDGQHPPAPK